jgi:uncharacterized protein (DUF2141 family)
MAIVVPAEFGNLSLGETNTFNGALNPNRRLEAVVFSTGPVNATVNISSAPRGNPTVQGADVDITLFQDTNGDRILDTDKDARIAFGSGRESNESISRRLSQGTYFIQASSLTSSFIPYSLNFSRSNSGANSLVTPEIPLGTISQDLRKGGHINDNNTADNFAFTLDGSSSLDINVRELGNKKGDVNIRVVQDRNGNGIVNRGDVVVQGVSTDNVNIDTISGFKGAGDYILQVCQTNGNTRFGVNFDHSAA